MKRNKGRRGDSSVTPSSKAIAPANLIRFGQLVGRHGLKGALKFRADNAASPIIFGLKRVFIERTGRFAEFQLSSVARVGQTLRVALEGVDSVDQAQELRGGALYVAKEDLPEPAAGEFYYFELVGFGVGLDDGRVLGTIAEVFSNGAHDVWVVKTDRSEVLIPVIDEVVTSIDTARRQVTIQAIPGLLD